MTSILGELIEITVLIVIILELFALYRNMKIEQRLDQHLQKTDALIKALDKHLARMETIFFTAQD
jgi:C4-dicarboxylate-specific signal transduction histidine kinase